MPHLSNDDLSVRFLVLENETFGKLSALFNKNDFTIPHTKLRFQFNFLYVSLDKTRQCLCFSWIFSPAKNNFKKFLKIHFSFIEFAIQKYFG